MKQKRTIRKPDGSVEIIEFNDDSGGAKGRGGTELAHVNRWEDELLKRMAAAGRNGDTRIAPVSSFQEQLLQLLGGSGTRNPQTGLKEYSQLYPVQGMTYDDAAPPEGYHWEYNEITGAREARKNCGGTLRDVNPAGFPSTSSTSKSSGGSGTAVPTSGMIPTAYGGPAPSTYPVTQQERPDAVGIPDVITDMTQQITPIAMNTSASTPPAWGGGVSGTGTSATGAPSTTSTTGTGTPSYLSGSQIASDFAGYFQNVPAGTTQNWAGGQLTKNADGSATYKGADGQSYTFNANTPLSQLYQIPGIRQAWDQAYGGTSTTTTGTGTTGTTGTTGNGFDMPTDIMPISLGVGGSTGTNESTSQSTQGSISTSNQYSGLPQNYQEQLLANLMPTLNSAVANMPGNIDAYTNQALGTYQQQMQNYMRENIPKAVNALASRGIISSTEGDKILQSVMSTAARDAGTKGYETAMQAAAMKANMPAMLGQIAQLGQSSYGGSNSQSTGQSTSSSSGNTGSYNMSYSEDPTVMYRTIADLIKQMMG